MSAVYSRTTSAVQGDTLDSIAHRYYAEQSKEALPWLVDSNLKYSPLALLPIHAVIILPDLENTATPTSIKLWD